MKRDKKEEEGLYKLVQICMLRFTYRMTVSTEHQLSVGVALDR